MKMTGQIRWQIKTAGRAAMEIADALVTEQMKKLALALRAQAEVMKRKRKKKKR